LSGEAILILLALYFLPTIIAALRGKSNTAAIFALNLFLGWTLIGWVISLVWSLTSDPKPPRIERHGNARPVANDARRNNTTLSSKEKIDQLIQLKKLLDEGVLTQSEFDHEKAKVLQL